MSKLQVLSRGKVEGSLIQSKQRTQTQRGEPAPPECVDDCLLYTTYSVTCIACGRLGPNSLSWYPHLHPWPRITSGSSAFSPQPPTSQDLGREHGELTATTPLVSPLGPWLCSQVPRCFVPIFHQTQGPPPSWRWPNELQSLLLNPLPCELRPMPQSRSEF